MSGNLIIRLFIKKYYSKRCTTCMSEFKRHFEEFKALADASGVRLGIAWGSPEKFKTTYSNLMLEHEKSLRDQKLTVEYYPAPSRVIVGVDLAIIEDPNDPDTHYRATWGDVDVKPEQPASEFKSADEIMQVTRGMCK